MDAVEKVKALAQRIKNVHRCAAELAGQIATALAELDQAAPAAPAAAPRALRRVAVTCAEHGVLERTLTATDAAVLERELRCPVCRRRASSLETEPAAPGAVVTPWSVRGADAARRGGCSLCGGRVIARGLCSRHYYAARRHGRLAQHPRVARKER